MDYLTAFENAGFDIVEMILEISSEAVEFRRRWPERFAAIAEGHPIECDDLVIKSNFVLLQNKT
jgi:hypothetical protein